jgi:glycosyltransferase involved in cell wall biosynthesis
VNGTGPPSPPHEPPRRVTLVLGTTAGGTGAHARMLAAGLAGRGVAVSVAGPSAADARLSFSAVPGVPFTAVEVGDRPRAGDLASILRLRRLLAGRSPGDAGVVHAHGMRAGSLSLLALAFVRGGRRPGVVVTVHNAPPLGGGAAALVYRLLERLVARGADLVLCVSPDLEARMRAAGAHRIDRAVIAAPELSAPAPSAPASSAPAPSAPAPSAPASSVPAPSAASTPSSPASSAAGVSAWELLEGGPVVLGVGRLAPQKGFDVLLEAAATWRDLDPVPLVVIAGDGPLAGELRARAAALSIDVVFAGHRDDVPALLATAAVFVLPSQWEGQPLVLQEALRAGAPVVATRAGGIPALAGDAALLVPPGDVRTLAAAVRSVLTDPLLAAALRVAAIDRAAALPSAADATDAALAAYAALGQRPPVLR